MWIAKTIEQLRLHRQQLTDAVAIVPTMGALHGGHESLIRFARQACETVIVTLFVNPTQFGSGEDFDHYPRPLDQDLERCRCSAVSGVFCPSVDEVYPPGCPAAELTVPSLASHLEGEHRPGHFFGVCRVVAKLFHLVQPTDAFFGQKDYQQLKVIQAMVKDLAMPIRVSAVPTVREPDGLAVSSRNVYLSQADRRQATGLYRALMEARSLVETADESDPAVVEAAMTQVLTAYQVQTDYAVIRHPEFLVPLDCIDSQLIDGVVALVAGRVGGVRLIDSMVLGRSGANDRR